ncbi:hypothetical protein [Mucilaginibacter sp. L196]|uniref:hypothetical protein n=1 Tax=Mucilaginibacter sp. L196 TaxID=1641870 RepID=UPI00131B3D71|nr:hypothetical protein [Mucilaginibacter sp. L196]
MSSNLHDKQKSLTRRFLLILGVATLVCVTILGLMIMFTDKLNLNMGNTQRMTVGGLLVAYGIYRSFRIFKTQPDDE